MSVTIKLRKGLASEWASNDTVVLASGEPGFELDTGRLKIGDGTSTWTNLDYVSIVPTGFAAGTGIGIDLGSNGSSATISVSGLINNPANNRILTSRDNTNTGIDAESNLTFDGSTLSIIGGPTATSLNMGHGGDQYFNLVQGSTSASGYLALGQHATVQTSPFNIAINNANNYSRTQTTDLVAVSGNFTVLDVDNLRLDGNTLSATNTNGELTIQTNGTGALKRDNGGNARGAYAVDLQNSRTSNTKVAAGNYSVVGGGRNNTSSGSWSTVGGGFGNSNGSLYGTIGGGHYNSTPGGGFRFEAVLSGNSNKTLSGNGSVICGGGNTSYIGYGYYPGNVITGNFNFIGGGGGYQEGNGINGNYCAVVGGQYNYAKGSNQFIGGGSSNQITSTYGSRSVIGGGTGNRIESSYDNNVIGGGSNNTMGINANHSVIPGGFRAKTTRYGELSHAAGFFANRGDAQHSVFIARKETSNDTAAVLTLNGLAESSSNRMTIPAKTTWVFDIKLSAYNDTDNEGGWWIIRGGIRRNAANGTALIGSLITESGTESSLSTASASVVADDTNEALEIRVTGVTGKNIRWVAVVDISQVSYGIP